MNFRKKRKIDLAIKIKLQNIDELENAVESLKSFKGSHKLALLVLRTRIRRIRSEVNELEGYFRFTRPQQRILDTQYCLTA